MSAVERRAPPHVAAQIEGVVDDSPTPPSSWWLDSVGRWLAALVGFVAAALLVASTVVVLLAVFYRYVLGSSLSWPEEISRWLFIDIVFAGAALATYHGQHLHIDTLVARFSPRARTALAWLSQIIMAWVLCYLVRDGWTFAFLSPWMVSSSLHLSLTWTYLAVPVGAALMLAFLTMVRPHGEVRPWAGLATVGLGLALFGLTSSATPALGSQLGIWLLVFAGLLMLGAPVAFVMLGSSLLFLLLRADTPISVLPQYVHGGMDSFPLLAVPFFILAGGLMETGGISLRLVEFARSLVGWVRGGLGMVVILSEYLFSGISGSTTADVSAIGSLLIPSMVRAGYSPQRAVAIVAAASAMGILVPPCIAMIILGVMMGVSIGALFAAGFIPAAVIALMLVGLVAIQARRDNLPAEPRPTRAELGRSFVRAVIPLLMPVIIFGAILGGITTPTEAAAVAVVYGLVVGVFVYREIAWRDLPRILVESAQTTGMVMFLVAAASLLAWTLTREGVPQMLAATITSLSTSPWVFLLISNVVFVLLGAVLEGVAVLIILIPLLMPLVRTLGVDPLHYGILVIMAIGIGVFLPPIGVCMYVACGIAKITMGQAARAFVPYLAVLLLGLLVITLLPWFTLVLPYALFPPK